MITFEQFNDMPIVCGGDWNLIMENIDKKGGSSVLTHKKNREHLRQFMDRNDLIDIEFLFENIHLFPQSD
jgi:exonuclease III